MFSSKSKRAPLYNYYCIHHKLTTHWKYIFRPSGKANRSSPEACWKTPCKHFYVDIPKKTFFALLMIGRRYKMLSGLLANEQTIPISNVRLSYTWLEANVLMAYNNRLDALSMFNSKSKLKNSLYSWSNSTFFVKKRKKNGWKCVQCNGTRKKAKHHNNPKGWKSSRPFKWMIVRHSIDVNCFFFHIKFYPFLSVIQ